MKIEKRNLNEALRVLGKVTCQDVMHLVLHPGIRRVEGVQAFLSAF